MWGLGVHMDLMAGPRGRRLCLEAALEWAHHDESTAGQKFATAVFHAAHDLDYRAGTSAMTYLTFEAVDAPPDSAPTTHTAADVVRLWATVPRGPVDAHVLMTALTGAVDAAAYWQPPDGDDVLAATEAMRGPLTEVAREIEVSAASSWWSAPVALADQCAVRFDYQEAGFPAWEADAASTLAVWREAIDEEEARARREFPSDPTASFSGAWWSKPPNALMRTTRSLGSDGPSGLWLVEDSHGPERARVRRVGVPSETNVYEIDGPEAWADLCRRAPLDVTASRRHDWHRTTGEAGPWVVPDWSRVAEEYDGVHLTVAGYLETAGRSIPVGEGASSVLAGWDPDTTYWFTDVRAYEDTEETWSYDDDRGWVRESVGL